MKLSNLVPNKIYFTKFCTVPLNEIVREPDGTLSVRSLLFRPAYYYVTRSNSTLVGMSVKTFVRTNFEEPIRAFNDAENSEFGHKLHLSLLTGDNYDEENSPVELVTDLLRSRVAPTDTLTTIAQARLRLVCEEHVLLNYDELATRLQSPHSALCFLATGWLQGDVRYHQFRSSIDLLEDEERDIDYQSVLTGIYALNDTDGVLLNDQ